MGILWDTTQHNAAPVRLVCLFYFGGEVAKADVEGQEDEWDGGCMM